MTSDDGWTDMSNFDAELDRLLSGGSPSAEAPAWFGDVAVLVRTARAPARPDELAGEADVVARMVQVRLSVLEEVERDSEQPAVEEDAEPDTGAEAGAEGPEAPSIPTVNGTNGVKPVNGTGAAPYWTAGEDGELVATAREPLEDRLRSRLDVSDLDDYRAKHGGERWYVAKHAAPQAEEPPHQVARTVGRVIAMKAVAVTTAAVLGVAAAAAATTGIVANVVVPAISDHYRRPVPTTESPTQHKDDDDGDDSGDSGNSRSGSSDLMTCETVLAPCVPPALGSVVTDPATGNLVPSPSTTAPTATSVPEATTTSTTAPDSTTTTETTPPTTTSTTVVGEPESLTP